MWDSKFYRIKNIIRECNYNNKKKFLLIWFFIKIEEMMKWNFLIEIMKYNFFIEVFKVMFLKLFRKIMVWCIIYF